MSTWRVHLTFVVDSDEEGKLAWKWADKIAQKFRKIASTGKIRVVTSWAECLDKAYSGTRSAETFRPVSGETTSIGGIVPGGEEGRPKV